MHCQIKCSTGQRARAWPRVVIQRLSIYNRLTSKPELPRLSTALPTLIALLQQSLTYQVSWQTALVLYSRNESLFVEDASCRRCLGDSIRPLAYLFGWFKGLVGSICLYKVEPRFCNGYYECCANSDECRLRVSTTKRQL